MQVDKDTITFKVTFKPMEGLSVNVMILVKLVRNAPKEEKKKEGASAAAEQKAAASEASLPKKQFLPDLPFSSPSEYQALQISFECELLNNDR